MNVVDSSAWIEFLVDGPNASSWTGPIVQTESLLVPTIVIVEVTKRLLRALEPDRVYDATVPLFRGTVVPLDAELAVEAARLGVEHRLPLADSIIYATAHRYDATVWTQDADFEGLPGVEYRAKA